MQNTRGGTVSGTVTTSPPFSIVSGSPFSLGGLGATQTVTARFTPTTPATVNTNVNFSANGDSSSRLVSGIGVIEVDVTLPTVTITSPTSNPSYSTGSSSVTLGGTASDNIGVTQVTWVNSRGGSGTATGTTSWTASGIVLQGGANVLTVTARDAAGNTATGTLTVTVTALTFTDDPLATSTPIKAIHVTELRAAIASVRAARGLAAFAWTDPTLTPGSTGVKAVHVTELRTALNQAYQVAGRTLPTYTDPTVGPGVTTIQAIHINQLRSAVRAL